MSNDYRQFVRGGWIVTLAFSVILAKTANGQRTGFDPFGGAAKEGGTSSRPVATRPEEVKASSDDRQLLGYRGPTINGVGFKDTDINLVLQVISDASGWSIFSSKATKGKVSVSAKEISAGDLLDEVVRMADLVQVRTGNIINIMTYEEYMVYYGVVKRTYALQYRDAAQITAVLMPFVTPRGKLMGDAQTRTLVIYEVPTNLPLLMEVIRKLDMPADSKVVKTVKLVYANATQLAEHLQGVFGNEQKQGAAESVITRASPTTSKPAAAIPDMLLSAEQNVVIYPVARTNHIILRGYPADLKRIEELIAQLDAMEDLETRHYRVLHLSAEDVLMSLEQSLGVMSSMGSGSGQRSQSSRRSPARSSQSSNARGSMNGEDERIRLSYLEESNAIVVTAPVVVHRQVAEFLKLCDTPPMQVAGGIRNYRLQNAAAADVAKILLELINQGEQQTERNSFKVGASTGPQITGPSAVAPPARPAAAQASPGAPPSEGGLIGVESERRTERPRITFSEATNTVIIQATVQEHIQFAQVIRELDRQMPQVLLEVMIVELRGGDDVDVGVELENFGLPGDSVGRLLFTSFGLSTVNPATGQRTLTPGAGGTAAITRTEDVPAIIHALQSTGKAKIRSAPRLLVNDNTQGMIQAIAEEPYSQVNASTTVATTSFGGFVQAGTQLQLTPHISNEDSLRLEYTITLNSFRGTSANPNLPPARDTSTINSQATIPDNGTLIVAGLSYQNKRENANRVPIVGNIPILNLAFGRTITEEDNTRLYVFVKPMILKDSQFQQLKRISEQERREAGEASLYPDNPTIDLLEE